MSYLTGPAALRIGAGPYLYSEAGFTVRLASKTGRIASALHGELGRFLVSRKAVITGRVVGMMAADLLAALFPATVIGASVATQAIEIWTRAGQKITWLRGGVTRTPELTFSATHPLFSGELEIACLGAPTGWNTVAEAPFTEATFDPALIKHYRYTAACGGAPFDRITAEEGFKVRIAQETSDLLDDNIGLADILLESLSATCTFTPGNLTEAQIWSLVQLQGTGAWSPGDLLTGPDLVITGDSHLTFTLSRPGFHDAATLYATGKLRNGELRATCARIFTGGTADPLFTFTQS